MMKWMCVIFILGGGPRIDHPDFISYDECKLWQHQQEHAPQYPIPVGPMVAFCEPYWEV
jgi:hypothetical protein